MANFIAPSISELLGAKWAMALGGVCYVVFQAGFLISLNAIYLYIASAVLGLGAAGDLCSLGIIFLVLWTGQGSYLAKNCTERTSTRNSGLLWAILQSSCVFFLNFCSL